MVRAFAEPKAAWIHSKLPLQLLTVLDVGGGNGYFSAVLQSICRRVEVVDISQEQLDMNPLPPQYRHRGSCYDLAFATASFDVVFASNLLHHLDHPDRALLELTRVAKKYVVIVEASNGNPIMRLGACVAAHEFRSRLHSEAVVRQLLTDAGLVIVHHTYHGGMLLPNRSATWTIPLSLSHSCHPWLSYFQIFIACKKD